MILDLAGTGRSHFEGDVCIVGAGPAGITLARQMAAAGASVVLLESGGLALEPRTQALYAGENAGLPFSLETSRLRYFGGSTGHWEGYCGPLDESDFSVRPWIPHSGWPIGRDELIPYWIRAHDALDLGPFEYDLPSRARHAPAFEALRTCFWRHSPPTRFNAKFRAEIRDSDRITCLLHANLLDLEGGPGGRAVRRALVGALDGASAVIRAGSFVLACGGIENARILLVAASRGDLVLEQVAPHTGRFFMEHVLVPQPATVVATSDWWRQYQRFSDGNFDLTPGLCLTEEAREEHAILSLAGMLRVADCPAGLADQVCLAFFTVAEQAPNSASRVTLGPRKDAFGLPVVKLEWRLTQLDRRTITIGCHLLAREIGRLGLGRTRVQEVDSLSSEAPWPANHHMGTTRMGDEGVVDPNCRVYGIDNLFVAGSSVFPTGGYINPTLTIVALSLRLADHLAGN